MRFLIIIALLFNAGAIFSQGNSLGVFTRAADIGRPKNEGSSNYDSATNTYNLKGSGYNIWFNRDEFHYLYDKINGDFVLTGNFSLVGDSGNTHNAHRKIGWMIRESEDESAVSINAVVHGDGLVVMQWRGKQGANMRDPEDEIFFPERKLYKVIQLERKGDIITMRIGNPGEPLQIVGSHTMKLPEEVLAGMFICSHDENVVEEAKVTDVKVDKSKKKRKEK